MRKVYSLILYSMFFVFSGKAQSVTQSWFTSYGTANYDQFTSVATDGSGNVYMTGTENASTWTSRLALIKYNSAGTMQWLIRYNGYLTGCNSRAIAVDGSGNVYVAGRATNGSQGALIVAKYSTNAQQLWVSVFDSSAILLEDPGALKVDASGNVYVGGTINSELYNYDLLVLKLNSSGVRQWVRTFNGSGNQSDFFGGLAMDPSGNVYITGQVYNSAKGNSSYDYTTIKYSTAGTLLWSAKYSYTSTGYEKPVAIAVDASGNAYVTGYSSGSSSGYDYATVKYNTSGALLWSARFNSPYNLDDFATAMSVDGSGNVYVTGNSRYLSSSQQMATLKYDANGAQQWVVYYWAGASTRVNAMGRDGSGNIYITGTDGYDVLTLKYTPTGAQNWAVRYNDYWNGTEDGQALAVYQSGSIIINTQASIYVGGSINTSGGSSAGYDLNLVKYTQKLVISSRSELEPLAQTPRGFSLAMVPNPARGPVNILYNLPHDCNITLKISDVLGKEVKTLDYGPRMAGQYQTTFNAGQLPGQMYYFTLVAKSPEGDYMETKPMILQR